MAKGKTWWVPSNIWNEIDDIKKEDKICSDKEAFIKLADYSKKGRKNSIMDKKLW